MSALAAELQRLHRRVTALLHRVEAEMQQLKAERDHWRAMYLAEYETVLHVHLPRDMAAHPARGEAVDPPPP